MWAWIAENIEVILGIFLILAFGIVQFLMILWLRSSIYAARLLDEERHRSRSTEHNMLSAEHDNLTQELRNAEITLYRQLDRIERDISHMKGKNNDK